MTTSQEIIAKQRRYLWPNQILYYEEPLVLDRGEGMYVWDVDGNRYLDFFAGILTTSVGHANPVVNAQILRQVGRLLHTSTLYPNETQVALAEALAAIVPEGLDSFYFGATGTDADETAILLAQVHTGNTEVIALRLGYSGKSQMAMSLTGQANWRIGPVHIGYIRHAMTPYSYRSPAGLDEAATVRLCLDDLEDVVRTMTTGKIAALLLEPIQGVGGFITLPDDYVAGAAEIARAYGALVIVDEVQTGFGRTGTHWWGHQHAGIVPDIMTMAKGIANGMPLAAVATRPDIAQSLVGAGLTISTFGGNPVACAAALGTLQEMQRAYHPARSERIGRLLAQGLERLYERYPLIGQVRGRGLMQGLELVRDRATKEPAPAHARALLEESRAAGLLIGSGGLHGNTLRIAPPLIADREHVDEALEKLDYALAQVHEMTL